MATNTWATVEDVLAITGQTVSENDVTAAGYVIDTWANRTIEVKPRLRPRDVHWLKVATAYQTVWQRVQPGYLTHLTNVTDYNQDGMLTRFDSKADQSLAPNAARTLKNLSWKITRTLRTKDVRLPVGESGLIDYLNEASDDLSVWTPLTATGEVEREGC